MHFFNPAVDGFANRLQVITPDNEDLRRVKEAPTLTVHESANPRGGCYHVGHRPAKIRDRIVEFENQFVGEALRIGWAGNRVEVKKVKPRYSDSPKVC